MMLLILVRVTALFLAATVAVTAMRKASAALRHFVCICALAGSLLMPATALLPARMIAIHLPVTIQAAAAATNTAPVAGGWWWSAIFLTVWALGCVVLLLRLVMGHGRAAKMVRSATAAGVDGVYFADVDVPIVCGLLRPAILMPKPATGWPEWQVEAAVRHERMHIRRNDLWSNFAAQVACAIWWFHPLIWILFRRLRNDQEAACDDAILFSGFEPATYAEALLAVARNSTPNLLNGCAMTTQMNLKSRITRLLDRGIARTTSRGTILRTAVAFAIALGAIAILTPLRTTAQSGPVYSVGDGVTSPRVLYKVDPEYTEEARAQKVSGPVTLSMVIGADGIARDINIVKGIGSGLDEQAAAAIEKWHFEPGQRNGEPVAVRAVVEVNFRLL
jgi:TonB family protein